MLGRHAGTEPGRLTEFYGAIFGWDFAGPGTMPGDGSPGEYHVARLRGRDVAGIGSLPAADPRPARLNTYVRVESADSAAADARAAGGAVVAEPFNRPPQGGWRSSPIPRAPPSAYGRRATVRARSSSTSRGGGA